MYSCYFFKAPSIYRSEARVWISFYTFNGHPQFSGLNKVNKGGQYCIKMAQNDHLFQCSMFQSLLINAYYFVVLLSENDNWF